MTEPAGAGRALWAPGPTVHPGRRRGPAPCGPRPHGGRPTRAVPHGAARSYGPPADVMTGCSGPRRGPCPTRAPAPSRRTARRGTAVASAPEAPPGAPGEHRAGTSTASAAARGRGRPRAWTQSTRTAPLGGSDSGFGDAVGGVRARTAVADVDAHVVRRPARPSTGCRPAGGWTARPGCRRSTGPARRAAGRRRPA